MTSEEGVKAVADVLDPIFIHAEKAAGIKRIATGLDTIEVPTGASSTNKFCNRGGRKSKVVTRLLNF